MPRTSLGRLKTIPLAGNVRVTRTHDCLLKYAGVRAAMGYGQPRRAQNAVTIARGRSKRASNPAAVSLA